MNEREPNVVKQRPNEESDASENGAVAVATDVTPPNLVQSSDIFKLNIDCFDEVFDYLPIKDLISVGKTCKRLQNVAGYCFRQNFSAIEVASHSNCLKHFGLHTEVTHLAQFIHKFLVYSRDGLQYFLNVQSKLRRLRQIEINYIGISQCEIDRMEEILCKVEDLTISECSFKITNYATITRCSKLRRLSVEKCDSDCNWLIGKCQTLEYFKFIPYQNEIESIHKVTKFLEQNPNIRKFGTNADYLCASRELIENANGIKFDDLAICFCGDTDIDFLAFCTILTELYERGIYQRLQLYHWGKMSQHILNLLASIDGLVKLNINCYEKRLELSILCDLEELYVYNSECIADMEIVANELINLKRIHFYRANADDIIPFMRKSVELEKIKVGRFYNGAHFSEDTQIIDLPALNEERIQLTDARKITLYVWEDVYLATKWTLKETNFALIRLKHIESFEWDHDFSF